MPPPHLLPDRLAAVLAVLYLIFNEGYAGRGELSSEALRLGGALAELMPDEPEAHGLLALMLLNDSRSEARFADGTVVLLRGPGPLALGPRRDRPGAGRGRPRAGAGGPRAIRAAGRDRRPCTSTTLRTGRRSRPSTASCTASPARRWSSSTGRPRWPRRATSRRRSLADGIELDGYHYLHSTRAELLRRLDRPADAVGGVERALSLVRSDAERAFLERRLDELPR